VTPGASALTPAALTPFPLSRRTGEGAHPHPLAPLPLGGPHPLPPLPRGAGEGTQPHPGARADGPSQVDAPLPLGGRGVAKPG